jgi:protein-S-isoprenylcysteine O-methyltransferase Ste14
MINLSAAVAAANFVLLAGGNLLVFRDTGGHRQQSLVTIGFPLLAALNIYNAFVHERPVINTGLSLLLHGLSSAVFVWATMTIGRHNFARAYGRHASHALVQQGPFRYLRHPIYTSYLAFWLAFVAATPGVLPIISVVVAAVVYNHLARAEEHHLQTVYPGYRQYMAHTRRFIPLIF